MSAKPTLKERCGVKHYLIDIKTPLETFSAGDFVSYSKPIIDKEEKIIITGGSWFYIKSLLDEKELPDCPVNPEVREYYKNLDNTTVYQELVKLDSKRAQKIHPNNKDKVIRSIEMCLYLKKPISEFVRKNNEIYKPNWFQLDYEREELYKRINKRVDLMIEGGLFFEWEKNKEKYPESIVLKNTIGYSEFFEFTYKDAIDKIKQHTRNFAKRQMTYFRSNQNIKKIKSKEEILQYLN